MAVKSWQLGYDATTGNFVELKDIADAEESDARRVAFENQVTAIMEQKGLLAHQAEKYITDAYSSGTTLDALKKTAGVGAQETAEDRGDVWGASDDTKGKSFLKTQEGITGGSKDMIIKLYTEGFGREPDAEGLKYWTDELNKNAQDPTKGLSYAKIAESFGISEEAQIRDVYHEEYGRDVDDVGLQYWMGTDDAVGHATRVIQDQNTLETKLRKEYAETLGQFSTEEERQANIAAGGFWTDVQEGGYTDLDWTNVTKAGGGLGVVEQEADYTGLAKFHHALSGGNVTSSYSGKQIKTLDDVRNILGRREDLMNISSTYDKDDAEGGSGIGRIFTLKEMEPYLHEAADLEGLAANLGATKWALLTKELDKTFKTFEEADYTGNVLFDPGHDPDQRATNKNTLSHDYQVPVPPDYEAPDTANVTRSDVDYMPKLDGTVPNRPLKNLDSSYTPAPQQAVRSQGPFVAGSALGVRRRKTNAARTGRSAMGTKQLARNNMQIKSLNL